MSCAALGVEEIHDVLSAMQKNLECPICLDLMKEPVSTRCDHIFCRFCMVQLLSKKKKGRAQCPLCKKEVTKRSLQESPRFKLLIDGLMKIINAFELDSGYKFFPSQDYAKSTLVECKEERKKEEERSVVQSSGYRNRNKTGTLNVGQCADLQTLLEIVTETRNARNVGTQNFNRTKRKKPNTNNIKSKRKLITEFESDSSEDDLFKEAECLGNDDPGTNLMSDRVTTDDPINCQDKDSRIHEANDPISLKPETEDVVASDLAEYGFSERDLESTLSNLLCTDGVKASAETTTRKRPSDARDRFILDGDFAEKDEQSPRSNLDSHVMLSEHNQSASTMEFAKHIPDESQALKIAIDYQYDKDDSMPDGVASTQSSPDVSCTVPKRRMKRSIQRVKEWLLKTSDFIDASSVDEEHVSETIHEVNPDGSDKGSSMSDETEIVPTVLPSTMPKPVEKPAITIEDQVFGKVYKRDKKSNPLLNITCVADVHVDAGVHSPKINAAPNAPCLKRKRRTTSCLQPEDFIKRVEVTHEDISVVDDDILDATHRLEDDTKKDEDSKYLKVSERDVHGNGLAPASDEKKSKRKPGKSQGKRMSDITIEKPTSSEIVIESYPSSNEPGLEDNQRKVRRSKRLNMLPLPAPPVQNIPEAKVNINESDVDINEAPFKTTVDSEIDETQIKSTAPTAVPNVAEPEDPPEKLVCISAQATDANRIENCHGQADVGNVLRSEEIEDSDIDTQYLLKTFKKAKRMSFKLDSVEPFNKENHNPVQLADANTNLPNGHQAVMELAASDKENVSSASEVPVSAPLSKPNVIGEDIQEHVQNLPGRLLKKTQPRRKKKHNFFSDNSVEGSGENTEEPVLLYENESLAGAGALNDLRVLNETKPHEEGNQRRNAAVRRSEELVLFSETESLSLHPVVTHQSLSAVRRGDTRSGSGQGENEQATDYCYQKHSFDEEQINQIISVNGPKFPETKKSQRHLESHECSPVISPEVLSDTPDGLLCNEDKSYTEAEKSFVFGNGKKVEASAKSVSPSNASQLVSRRKRRAQKLESSEEESSEEEELPCFNHLFGNTSSAGQKNASATSSPKQQGGGMFSSDSTCGKSPSLTLPKGALSSSQESVNLFSSQSNTSDHLENGNQNHVSKLPGSPENSPKRDSKCNDEEHIDHNHIEINPDYEDFQGEQNPGDVSGCESEASHNGDSSGLSSQCEILNTQQRDAMQNKLEKMQREMDALEACLKQHGTRSPSSESAQASTAERATIRLQEARQEQTDHGEHASPDAVPDTVQSEKCAEQCDERWESPTPPPSFIQTASRNETPEKVRTSLKVLEELKDTVLTQKDSNSKDQMAESGQPTKLLGTTVNQATVSPKRSMRVSMPSHVAVNGLSTRKGRLPMQCIETEPNSRQTSNGSFKRSSSPTFVSPTRGRTGVTSGKIPVIPNRRNFSLVASGLSQNELMLVQKFVRKTQSLLCSQMSESTTHVIMKTDEHLVCERTLKYFLGIAGRKWVVSYDWIVQSFREGRILDEYDFEVRGDVINGRNHRGPRRSRLGLDGLLLSDFEICCLGTFKDMTRENLEWMVSLCGASVVKEPQLFKHKEGTKSLVVLQSDGNTDYAAMKKKYRALIVSREWVLDSVASYQLQMLDSYML